METIRPIVSESHPKDKPSLALIGLAISVGASSILLPQQTDSVRATELMTPEFSDYSIHNPELTTEPFVERPALPISQTDLTLSNSTTETTSNLPASQQKIRKFSAIQDATSLSEADLPSQPTPIVQTIVLEPTDQTHDLVSRVTVITADTDRLSEAVSAPFPSQNLERYQVQSGDTLSSIASIYGVTVAEIVQINRLLDANQLQADQILNVPTISADSLDLVEERSPELDRKSAPTQSTSQVGQSSSTQEYQSTSVKTLKADLTKLRQKYQAHKKRLANPVSTSTQTPSQLRVSFSAHRQRNAAMRWQQESKAVQTLQQQSSAPATQPQPPIWEPAPVLSETQSSTAVAMAPLSSDSYQPHISPQMVSPDIPPLQGPETYLPNLSGTLEGYIWPAQGVLTSGYGWRWGRMHAGIDIAGPIGTPVVAAGEGVVVYARWNEGGYGNLVEIEHPDGSITRYAHNDRILVHEGQNVDAGQQISEMGSTGYSTGPHLHFEIHTPGQGAQNPIAYLPAQ